MSYTNGLFFNYVNRGVHSVTSTYAAFAFSYVALLITAESVAMSKLKTWNVPYLNVGWARKYTTKWSAYLLHCCTVHCYVVNLILVTPSRRLAHSLDRIRSIIVVSPLVRPKIVFTASIFTGRLDSSATALSATLRRAALDNRAFVIYYRCYNGVWKLLVRYNFRLRSRECSNYSTANSSTRAIFLAGEADGVAIVVEGRTYTTLSVKLFIEFLVSPLSDNSLPLLLLSILLLRSLLLLLLLLFLP